jgi:hypothetical protein
MVDHQVPPIIVHPIKAKSQFPLLLVAIIEGDGEKWGSLTEKPSNRTIMF